MITNSSSSISLCIYHLLCEYAFVYMGSGVLSIFACVSWDRSVKTFVFGSWTWCSRFEVRCPLMDQCAGLLAGPDVNVEASF